MRYEIWEDRSIVVYDTWDQCNCLVSVGQKFYGIVFLGGYDELFLTEILQFSPNVIPYMFVERRKKESPGFHFKYIPVLQHGVNAIQT